MAWTHGKYTATQRMTDQTQITQQIEKFMAGHFIGKAKWSSLVGTAVIAQSNRVVGRRPQSQAKLL